jgi:hypothetical protein
MATLERPAKAQLDEEIMTSLGSESSPITLEQILAKLRSTSSSSRSVYMHDQYARQSINIASLHGD